MGHAHEAPQDPVGPPAPGTTVYDNHWTKDLRDSVRYSAALLALLLLVDWVAGDTTPWRGALWLALAAVLFVVLYPPRVRAGEGWLASRGLLSEHRVRTDLLASVHCLDGVGQRLVLRDTLGGRVEIDTRILLDNPGLWHRLAEDARVSEAFAAPELRRVSARLDRETALTVFRLSGLE
ncbi:hypothetical protein [Streptomyces dysideae]|uniref:Uncharacterized protein n=1 Tax=Streptomyces dysideae TaxID=909626 RepID=A0A101UWA5_9ACTN|nr:hypothetical protein [Streptomyces dysideae]KUO18015.1 hypothetical protein AQJ91_26770 [Streptomyces dysideae]